LAIEDQDWSANGWTAMALERGYSHLAIIVSTDVYDKMAIDDVMARVEGSTLRVGYFDEPEGAAAWIKQLEVVNS
jgi:DICT domain-containing protein